MSFVAEHIAETVSLDGVTLLKGRVNTQEVFGLSNSDLVPGKYEVAQAINRGTDDLVLQKASTTRMQVPQLSGE
ncbi:hypothetical protein QN277_022368 [Acacia crassicarpa]|uniref:Uncharacterized protein n=1 Tax=Acacia crassicarpa TaxID=499986 RepID=A0AAE1JHM2_9FABA|nr:hypothetical protein QN277_022368 [Acacia crassicarpa]